MYGTGRAESGVEWSDVPTVRLFPHIHTHTHTSEVLSTRHGTAHSGTGPEVEVDVDPASSEHTGTTST